MLILPFWQTISINMFLLSSLLFVVLRKSGMRTKKLEFVETSD